MASDDEVFGALMSDVRPYDGASEIDPITIDAQKERGPEPGAPMEPAACDVSGGETLRATPGTSGMEATIPSLDRRVLRRLRRGVLRPDLVIDLHGLKRDLARRRLLEGIRAAAAEGQRVLLVIHGRGLRSEEGRAVLRSSVPEWLGSAPLKAQVLAHTPALPRDGGDGALYLLLRRQRRSLHRD